MRDISYSKKFKKDLKRERKGRHKHYLQEALASVLDLLANDSPLAEHYRDHALTGDWKDFRDCHLEPDLVLIYRKPTQDKLELARLGSHSELGI